jgi:hypothetical protein
VTPIRQQARRLTSEPTSTPWRLATWLTNMATCLCGPRSPVYVTLNDGDDFLPDK